jgi:3-oxoacyl-[acyl-carrier-protein] synthase II
MARRRVVVTGLGAVTPLGIGAKPLHERWAAGEVGIVDGAGTCTDFEPKDFLSVKEIRRLDRFSQLGIVAADEAIEQAGWNGELPYDSMRIGCIIATGIGGIETVETQHDVMRDRGAKMVSPLGIPLYMPNAGAAAVSMKHGLQGQMYGLVSACSGGAHAIGSALRMIQYGDADAVVAGGAEAALTAFGFACFNSMQALSPTGMSRPFDARRDGFVMGEGAGVLVLEEEEAARERGATILGEVIGYGSTADAYHKRALGEDRAKQIPVSSTKSSIGHLLGAAGAVEAVATIEALDTRVIPPTLGYEVPDPELDLDYVPGEARPLISSNGGAPVAISNSFAFGGHNVSLILQGASQ